MEVAYWGRAGAQAQRAAGAERAGERRAAAAEVRARGRAARSAGTSGTSAAAGTTAVSTPRGICGCTATSLHLQEYVIFYTHLSSSIFLTLK